MSINKARAAKFQNYLDKKINTRQLGITTNREYLDIFFQGNTPYAKDSIDNAKKSKLKKLAFGFPCGNMNHPTGYTWLAANLTLYPNKDTTNRLYKRLDITIKNKVDKLVLSNQTKLRIKKYYCRAKIDNLEYAIGKWDYEYLVEKP